MKRATQNISPWRVSLRKWPAEMKRRHAETAREYETGQSILKAIAEYLAFLELEPEVMREKR